MKIHRICVKAFLSYLLLAIYCPAAEKAVNPLLFPDGWRLNKGWPSELKPEFREIKNAGEACKGEKYAFVRGHFLSRMIEVKAGDELEVRFYVKDPREKDISCLFYAYTRSENGKLKNSGIMPVSTHKTAAEWTEVTTVIKIPERTSPVDGAIVVLASNTGAFFDYASVADVKISEFSNPLCARYEARGRTKLAEEDYEGAIKEWNSALPLAAKEEEKKHILPQISSVYETRGRMRLANEDFGGAREELDSALKFAVTEKDRDRILAEISRARRLEKIAGTEKKTEGLFLKADAYEREGRYGDARKEYESIRKKSRGDFLTEIALFNTAGLYRKEKNYASAHTTYNELFSLPDLTGLYRIYGLFRQAETYIEQGQYSQARSLYDTILKSKDARANHVFRARLFTGDTHRNERKHKNARSIYEGLLRELESSAFPHESYRMDIIERLEAIEGLADGAAGKSRQEKWAERVKSLKYSIYVSPSGSDNNPGTERLPFATIPRAQEEVRRVKSEKGMPSGGIAVYLRGGRYFLKESLVFEGEKDSGTENSPVVYRNFPGEEVRLIGGQPLNGFKPLEDPDVLRRLPEEAKGKIWVTDLKEEGIDNYGELFNRGHSHELPVCPGAMELFFNTKPMHLSRYPDNEWLKTAGLVTPEGDGKIHNKIYQKGSFRYSEDRIERWKEEKEIWTAGYFMWEWDKIHARVLSMDTGNRIITLSPDTRHPPAYILYNILVRKDAPHFFYNILSELSSPEEFYVDRDAGKLYFYPPGKIEGSETIASTLNSSIIKTQNASNLVFYGLTLEATWLHAIEMTGGKNNLVAGATIRNTGVTGIWIKEGWNHGVVGCDIYDTGEGGIRIEAGDRAKLIPGGNYAENNHVHRFNRFSFRVGQSGIVIHGTGNRASHNLLHDAPYCALFFGGNDNLVEYNEIYDSMYEGRDGGAMYTHSGSGPQFYIRNRGNVMRRNFIHHINGHFSPITTHEGCTGLYIDGISAGMTMEGNILHRCTTRAMQSHGPDTRIENNIFSGNKLSLLLYNNAGIMEPIVGRGEVTVGREYKIPPWGTRYPQLVDALQTEQVGITKNVVLERNVNREGVFTSIISHPFHPLRSVFRENISISDNWEEGDPLFADTAKMDFRIRPGSPVFGLTSIEPVPFENMGIYNDALRASWPVKKDPPGKYYKEQAVESSLPAEKPRTVQKSGEPRHYGVRRKTAPVTIDGYLEKTEWFGLDKKQAMCICEDHVTGKRRYGAESYAWLLYDDECLYMGIENAPDPWKEGLRKEIPVSLYLNEITIEGLSNSQMAWWKKEMPTGPLYIFTGYAEGRFIINNIFNMPQARIAKFEEGVKYKARMIDQEQLYWTAEWKIPFSALGLSGKDVKSLRFNIGAPKRDSWYAWMSTGDAIWRLDKAAGILNFNR